MIRTICSRTSSDYKRLTKHENEDAQWIIARSENVCDKPGNTLTSERTDQWGTRDPRLRAPDFWSMNQLLGAECCRTVPSSMVTRWSTRSFGPPASGRSKLKESFWFERQMQ
nr:hypothetical protein SHINE37_20048 [Rhizobiaceae bacterium]